VSTCVLGIDVGTSGLKAVLLDRQGQTIDEATAAYGLRTPRPAWTEQDPEDWWTAAERALRDLWVRGHRAREVHVLG
jgi:xylulokinase